MSTFIKEVCIQSITCRKCGKTFEFPTFREDFERFEKGEHIQYVLPYISPEYRELMLSGICPTCWKELMETDEEE
jgi:DNA-directed RNA polymerase subunit RPC12/RpoP